MSKTTSPITVLVADDDAVTRRLLAKNLEAAGFAVVEAADGAQALQHMSSDVAVALLDLQMPEKTGLECLAEIRAAHPDCQVIVISQFAEIRNAVDAMKQGAFEYVTKPIDPDELISRVRNAWRTRGLTQENRQLRQAVSTPAPAKPFIGESEPMILLMDQARKVAQLDSTVLITGESGTGKTTLARWIHQAGGRAGGPFVVVSCAALPADLVEDELFGHVKGAYTGAVADRPGRAEMADGGTLFLDEIGDMPLELQPKLLNLLQDKSFQRIGDSKVRNVDARVIAATHQDLVGKCREKSFREDLFFRLNVLPLHLPALRDRSDEILLLCEQVLRRLSAKIDALPLKLTKEAQEKLLHYDWPGNVRELENVLERAFAFCSGEEISADDLVGLGEVNGRTKPAPAAASLAGRSLADIEKQAILDTLEACSGNKKAAAKMLGIDEKSIYNKIKRLGISDEVAKLLEKF